MAVEGGFAINRFLPVLACHLLVAALATATRAEQESPGATAPASGPTGLNPGRQPINQFVFTGPMSAHPGDLVDLAVSGTTDPHIKGYSIVLQWDPAVFVLSSGPTLTGTRGQGAFLFTESHNTRGIKAAVIYSIACPPEVPPGTGPLLRFTLQVKSNAPTGPTVLDLADRPPAVNRVTDCSGASQAPDLIDAQFIVERTPGACCLADSCLILMADQCGSFGGEYLGNGVPCDPNPCSPLASAPHGSVGPPLGGLRAIPNPTAGEVEILYGTERTGPATFKVFNARGVVVRRVALAAQAHGSHGIRWDGKDQSGHPVPSGIYVIRIEAADGVASGKVVVVRK